MAIQRAKLLDAFEAALKELGIGGSLREQAISAMKQHLGDRNTGRVKRPALKLVPLALSAVLGGLVGVYAPRIVKCEGPINACQMLRQQSVDARQQADR